MIGTVKKHTSPDGTLKLTHPHSPQIAVEVTTDGWITTTVGYGRMDGGSAEALAELLHEAANAVENA